MGTALLRAYMHGFFIDNRLYNKAVSMVNPMGYEQYRQQRLAAKMEEDRKGRISMVRKLPKVRVKEQTRGKGKAVMLLERLVLLVTGSKGLPMDLWSGIDTLHMVLVVWWLGTTYERLWHSCWAV